MSLERQGTRDRTLRGMERRTEQQGRTIDDRITGLNPSEGTTFMGGTILADIEISTTPAAFTHGLRQAASITANQQLGVSPLSIKYAGRAFQGAWIIKGNDGSFQLLVSSIGDDTKVIGLACDSGGPFTVSVAVV